VIFEDERDRFAEQLVRLVRDEAINTCDRYAAGTMQGPQAKRWEARVAQGDVRAALAEAIPDIVDEVLFRLLDAVDNERLALGWLTEDGRCVPLEEVVQGESAGWYAGGEDGWLPRFSQQRFIDDAADL
jgi:hypothetical protein